MQMEGGVSTVASKTSGEVWIYDPLPLIRWFMNTVILLFIYFWGLMFT